MPVPVNRSKILPARGSKAVLDESLAELLEGEMAYATDERRYYQKQGGVLVPVGGDGSGSGGDGGTGPVTVTTADVATTDGTQTRIDPDLPESWEDLKNQREVNHWLVREVTDRYRSTTLPVIVPNNGQGPRALPPMGDLHTQQDFNNWTFDALSNLDGRVTSIELNGGGVDLDGYATEEWVLEQLQNIEPPDVDLSAYATKEELEAEAKDRADGDKHLQDQIDALEQRLALAFVATQQRPADPIEGMQWMDPARMQLMVFWRGAWVPSNPCGCGDGSDKCLPLPDLNEVNSGVPSPLPWCYESIPDLLPVEKRRAKIYAKRKG